jgi:glycosyltransferase involved in cell wall biosynthesis
MAMNRRLKVLVSAYACSPYEGSEPGVGWGFVSALSEHHDLWVIVEEEKFRAGIERYLREHPYFARRVHFYFLRKQRNRWLRKLWPPSYYWYYRRWHEDAYLLGQRLHREVSFDLAHQLTMVGFREPGYLWKLGIPFVWGPVGGMGLFPLRFLPAVGMYGALYYLGYNLLNWSHMNLLARPRQAAGVAASGLANGLIAATSENRAGAAKYWGRASALLNEVGLPCEPVRQIRERGANEPLRLIWTGLHIPRKALNLAFLALSRLPAELDWELHILGKGPLTVAWQQLANELGITAHCRFHGWMSREQALEIMQAAHLMLITSLRDLTSTVTVEALALGLPIVCLDHCGFADVVNEQCGIKIPVTTPVAVVESMARAIEELARDENKRRTLARGALHRARDFAWDEKACLVDGIYQAKVSGSDISGMGEP